MLSWLIFVCGLLGYQRRCNIAEESKRRIEAYSPTMRFSVICNVRYQTVL